jgi:hypothetical protein
MSERQKPWGITREELDLRFDYAEGKITLVEYDRRYAKLKQEGKIVRDGRVIRE